MFAVTIADEARSNENFRAVLTTSGHTQVVVMALKPGEDIGAEVHEHNDQVLTFVQGRVRAEVAGESAEVGPGTMVVVPAGTEHNFTNIGDEVVKLYTIYGPPDHAEDTVHRTKDEAEEAEEKGLDVPPPEHD